MSRVMPGTLLTGVHTVRLAPCEESRTTLHAAPSPSLPPPCPYYTTEGWGTQALMAPTPSKGSPGRLQQAPQVDTKASGTPQDLDSYIDFSLETLNQMILELDPTFQLLPAGTGGLQARPVQSQGPQSGKEEPEVTDIKYIEVSSPRLGCRDGPPRRRDVPRETRSSAESLIFSGSQGRGPSPSIPIPFSSVRASGPHGPCAPLPATPGLEKEPRALTPQRGSRVSVLSASPASDVSYVFGSTQSLLHSSVSSRQSSPRSLGSPASSSSSLHSLGPVSWSTRPSDVQAPSSPAPGVVQPRVAHSPPPATEHTSSCPPSITNSMVDIPIVLINGSPEPQSPPPRGAPGPQGSVWAGAASPNQHFPPTRGHAQTPPGAPAATAPEGPTRDAQPTMKFVMDTSKYWFKPNITREKAIELLRKEEPGAFVIRDSSSYRGSFGLALKVPEAPAPTQHRAGEDAGDPIRHFLIESSAKGVHLKGADEEPYFGSLSAFVCQHSIMALALPCPLAIPRRELGAADGAAQPPTDSPASSPKKSAGCHTLYLSSVSVETLSGALAVQKAISATLQQDVLPTPTVVHFRVTEQGITLTDVQRKVFFRRHYPLSTLRFCGTDPEQRKWQKYCKASRIFGFVAKSQTEPQENVCHLFAEYDAAQPAERVLGLVRALLQEAERV